MSPNQSIPDGVDVLISHARAADSQPPFSDQSLVELARGDRTLVESERDGANAGGAVVDSAVVDSAVVGAAVVSTDEFELVVDPDSRGTGVGTALVERVLAEHPAVEYAWAHGDHPASRALATRFGFEPVRTLLQLHAPVTAGSLREPQGTDENSRPEDLEGKHTQHRSLPERRPEALETEHAQRASRREPQVTPFRPGTDDTAWLALNSRAFADHPEQGGLTQQDLDDRKAENWFNAGDFLILRDNGSNGNDNDTMIGFCWLKIATGDEEEGEEARGEFYAVGMDPDRQGEGLGRVLMDAGFSRLSERGIRTATLYVEADNEPALKLYHRYGFEQHTIDVRYQRTHG